MSVTWTQPADAHLVATGLGPFYDGVGHLFVTPEDLVALLALILLAGQGGRRTGRLAMLAVPVAWLVGGVLGAVTGMGLQPAWSAVSFAAVGGLVALGRPLPPAAFGVLAALVGLFHGALDGTSMAADGDSLVGLLGIVASVFMVAAIGAALVVSLEKPWTRIAVRVAGSWIVAIGLLYLGWSLGPSV